jgi:hypothetical protein
MAHDVFISYSARDKPYADAVCAKLEARGIRCWIAPRDIQPGSSWGGAIVEAINGARVMLLLFSSHANVSPQIKREVEHAVQKEIVIVSVRVENVAPTGDFEYFLGTPHWLDAITPPFEQHLDQIVDSAKFWMERTEGDPARPELPVATTSIRVEKPTAPVATAPIPQPRTNWWRIAAVAVVIIALASAAFFGTRSYLARQDEAQEAEQERELAEERQQENAAADAEARAREAEAALAADRAREVQERERADADAKMREREAEPASTGVVISEVETSVSGQTGTQSRTYHRTLVIDGNRQRMITDGGRSVIIDLDQGTLATIDAARQSYTVMAYPLPGKMGGSASPDFEFVKTGGSERIAGYGCEMYTGKRKLARSEVYVTTCISSEAPGAAEFTTFQNNLRAKLAAVSSPTMPARLPDGIPLAQSTITRMSGGITNMSPQVAANLRKPAAGRALVIKTEVTSVRAEKIPDSEFEIPSGYTRR